MKRANLKCKVCVGGNESNLAEALTGRLGKGQVIKRPATPLEIKFKKIIIILALAEWLHA